MTEKDLLNLSDLAEQVKISDKRARFFEEKFRLRWNPFPEIGVPTSDVEGMAPIRQRELKRIGELIREAVVPPYRRRVIVVRGAYGSGKSFVLRKIAAAINQSQKGKAEGTVMAVNVPRPSIEAHALNKAILESIGLDTIRKMVWRVIRKELAADRTSPTSSLRDVWKQLYGPSRRGVSPAQKSLFDGQTLPPSLSQTFDPERFDDYRRFLEVYDQQGWNRSILQQYFSELFARGLEWISSASVPEAYIKLLLATDNKSAWDALLELDIKRKGDKTDFVLRFLRDLLSLLRAEGYVYLFVVVDEFEQATMKQLLTPRQQADYAYTIMEIITNIETGLGLVIGITPEGYENLSRVVPLADRLAGTIIDLNPLKPQELGELMKFYLEAARPSPKSRVPPLFPFSDELAEVIVKGLQPIGLGATPRNALQFLHFVLEHYFENKIDLISEKTITECLSVFRQKQSLEQKFIGRNR